MPYFQTACYQVTIQNNATGKCFGCRGRIRKLPFWHVQPIPDQLTLPPGIPELVHFRVTNSGPSPLSLSYTLSSQSSDGDAGNQVVSLNGLPPGEPVFGTLIVAPGDSSLVEVQTVLTEFQPDNVNEVVFSADVDGDGVPDDLTSVALFSETEDAASQVPEPPASVGGAVTGTILEAAPNPFHDRAGIQLHLGAAHSAIRVEVYDVGGRLVRTLFSGTMDAGQHLLSWDGTDDGGSRRSAGLYFVRAQAPGMMIMTKVVRLE